MAVEKPQHRLAGAALTGYTTVMSVTPVILNDVVYARFRRRLAACIIDNMLLLIAGFLMSRTVGPFRTQEQANLIGLTLGLLMNWLYFAGMESSQRQATWGKIIAGIFVTDVNGHKLSFIRATGRYFGKYVSGIIVGVGFLMICFTKKKQALHDILAGSLVVLTDKAITARNRPIINKERGFYDTIVPTTEGTVSVMTRANKGLTNIMPAKYSQLGRLGIRIYWTTSDPGTLEECHNGIVELVKETGLPSLRQWADAYRESAASGLPIDDMGGLIKQVI